MIQCTFILTLCMASLQARAERPPDAIMDSCLSLKATRNAISVSPIEGSEALEDDYEVPGYTVFKPGVKSNDLGVGYATSQHGIHDFVLAGKHRGYINRAISLGKYRPERIEPPERASYAVVREGTQRYVCVVESNGQGSAAFVRSAFVARIPSQKTARMTLYYKVADVKKFKAFNENGDDHPTASH